MRNDSLFPPPSSRRRGGLSFIYVLLIFIPLIGFAAFAVDIGRVRLAKADLQTAADASARAAAALLPDGNSTNGFTAAQGQANSVAQDNTCLSEPVSLVDSQDIVYGIWDPIKNHFAPSDASTLLQSNAVRIITRRLASRNDPIKLYIAPILGFPNAEVEAQSVAYIDGNPDTGYGIVGLDSITTAGNTAYIDSYTPPNYPSTPSNDGSIASNGDITLGNSDVYGDVRAGGTISPRPNTTITGWQGPLNTTLSYPDATVPGDATPLPGYTKGANLTPLGSTNPNNPLNYSFTGTFAPGDINVPAGQYVALYINGDVTIVGNSVDPYDYPLQLRIYVIGAHTVTIGGTVTQKFELYAPQSDVTIEGNVNFFGSIIGKTVTLLGTSQIHYDLSNAFGTPTGYKITTVY